MDSYSDILFAEPSLVEGLARALDLGDTLTEYNSSPTGEQADYAAIAADWATVGGDLRSAMMQVEGENEEQLKDASLASETPYPS